MVSASLLACGPYLRFADKGLEVVAVMFLIIKPLAYYAYIRAFRYRVSRNIPMPIMQAAKLTLYRTLLGVVLVGGGTALFLSMGSTGLMPVLAGSWLYLYGSRFLAWWLVGSLSAGIRGRRLFGWVLGGTLINAGFDFAVVIGLLEGPSAFFVVGAIAVFILILHLTGRRASLKARFEGGPYCRQCQYNLTGNLSGICPECGTPIVQPAYAR